MYTHVGVCNDIRDKSNVYGERMGLGESAATYSLLSSSPSALATPTQLRVLKGRA